MALGMATYHKKQSNFFNFFFCVCACYDMHVEVREQLCGASSLFPSLYGF